MSAEITKANTAARKTRIVLLFQFLTLFIGMVCTVALANIGVEMWGAPLFASVIATIVMGFTAGNL